MLTYQTYQKEYRLGTSGTSGKRQQTYHDLRVEMLTQRGVEMLVRLVRLVRLTKCTCQVYRSDRDRDCPLDRDPIDKRASSLRNTKIVRKVGVESQMEELWVSPTVFDKEFVFLNLKKENNIYALQNIKN
jgi:hypothetical protein